MATIDPAIIEEAARALYEASPTTWRTSSFSRPQAIPWEREQWDRTHRMRAKAVIAVLERHGLIVEQEAQP